MKINSCRLLLLCTASLVAGVALSATNYVVPWYVNPALKARFGVPGADAFEPVSLRLSPEGKTLAFTAAADDAGAANVQVFRMSDLVTLDLLNGDKMKNGAETNLAVSAASAVLGLGTAPCAVPSDTLGVVLGLDGAAGAARALPNVGRRWTGRFAARDVAVSGELVDVRALDLAASGAEAWSCAATCGAVTRWTVAGDAGTGALALTRGEAVATGLAALGDIAVYAIGKTADKTSYAVVGEADGAAATCGDVRLVNLATKDVTTLVTDAARLGGGIVSVRMSHVDTFRPRLYVLTAAGDLACYYLAEDLSTATWSRTFPNAELLALVQAPFAADAARVCAFEVSADGGSALVAYRAVGETAPTGPMTVALLRHTPTVWRFYAAGEEGNPGTAGEACISDGRWALRYSWADGGIKIGAGTQDEAHSGNAYANAFWGEYMDFSFGFVSNVTQKTRTAIVGHCSWGLGTNETHRVPRVLLHSPQLNTYDQAKGWDGMEELVVGASNIKELYGWLGFYPSIRRIVFNFPNVKRMNANAFASNNSAGFAGHESDAAEWAFPALEVVHYRALGWSNRKGVVDLPSAVVVSNAAFYASPYLTEARLAVDRRTLAFLGDDAFNAVDGRPAIEKYTQGGLRKVTLGGVDGFFFGKNVFKGQPLEEVEFTGGVPAFAEGVAQAFPDTAARTLFFTVPRGNTSWEAALAGRVTPLSEEERKAVWAAHPTRPIPFGVVAREVFRTAHEQYVCYADGSVSCHVTIEHDTFFGDAVDVRASAAPGPDGGYFPGTTLTLTPRPAATGTFRKWYGDVAREAETNATLTLVVTNDVWLFARFTHPWALSDTRDRVSNGNYTLICGVLDATARTLQIGWWGAFALFAGEDEGTGVLDLGGEVVDGDGARWTFAQWGGTDSFFVRQRNGKGDVETFLSPGTITGTWPGGQPLHATHHNLCDPATGVSRGMASYRTFILDEPRMTGTWGAWTTCGQTGLSRLILRTPCLEAFRGDGALWDLFLDKTRFDWWDLAGLKTLTDKSFARNWNAYDYAAASGTLALPSLRNVEGSLHDLPNAEALVLGGVDQATTVTNIVAEAFRRDPKLRTVTIHNAADMAVGATPFKNGATPREMTFTGPALAETALANLLADVTAAATKPVIVYASAFQGWDRMDCLDAATPEERAQVPGARVLGVYRGGAAAPAGKALVVHRRSPFDATPLYLIFR